MLSVLKHAFKEFLDDECMVRAAALAYYTIFALPPLLILLIFAAGAVWDPQDVQGALERQFASLVGNDGAQAIRGMIQSADEERSRGALATALGIVALLLGATGVMLQLQGALNRAWDVTPDPAHGGWKRFVGKRLLSLGMVLGIAFMLIVSLAVTAMVAAAGSTLSFIPAPVLEAVNFVLSLVVLTLLFAAMFRFVPDAEIAWNDVWVGAAVTSLLFVLGKFAIGLYLGRSSPGDPFGAASALAVILVWTYYAGMIVLYGAEFTQAWAEHHGARIEPEKGAMRLDRGPKRKQA
jgi:membrane protein